jgi:hypothetical protein
MAAGREAPNIGITFPTARNHKRFKQSPTIFGLKYPENDIIE